MNKKERLKIITDLISSEEISTQEELTARLVEKGYDVSQATISRDINELDLIKIDGVSKKSKYVLAGKSNGVIPDKIVNLFKQMVVSFVKANNLVVVKTMSGHGAAIGMAIDEMNLPQVLGTIAGDDTLLVVAKDSTDAEIVIKTLRTL